MSLGSNWEYLVCHFIIVIWNIPYLTSPIILHFLIYNLVLSISDFLFFQTTLTGLPFSYCRLSSSFAIQIFFRMQTFDFFKWLHVLFNSWSYWLRTHWLLCKIYFSLVFIKLLIHGSSCTILNLLIIRVWYIWSGGAVHGRISFFKKSCNLRGGVIDNCGWKTSRKICRLANLLKMLVGRILFRLVTLGGC